jgi:hypothetical protein
MLAHGMRTSKSVDKKSVNIHQNNTFYFSNTLINVAVWTLRPDAGRIQQPLGAPLDRGKRPGRHGNLEEASSQPDATHCILVVARRDPSFCSIRTD